MLLSEAEERGYGATYKGDYYSQKELIEMFTAGRNKYIIICILLLVVTVALFVVSKWLKEKNSVIS